MQAGNTQDPDLFSGIVLFVLLGAAGIAMLYATKNHKSTISFQVKLFLCAFGLRFLVSAVIYAGGLINIIKDEDASGWLGGLALYKQWSRKGIGLFELPATLAGAFTGQHRGYEFMVGALFDITGAAARLPAAVLNCFIGAITVVLVYRIARSIFSEWVAVRVAWLTCVLPSMLIWSAQTLKEPVVILLETVVLYGCVRLKSSGFSVRHVVLCGLAIILVLPFRFYAAYIAGAAVALSLVLPQFGKRKMSLGAAIGLAVLVIPIVGMSGVLVQSEAQIEKFDLKRIKSFREDVAVGSGSGVAMDFDLNSPVGFGMATGVGGAYLLLAPFPWQLGGGSARMVLTAPELFVWWWIFFVGVIPGLWYCVKNHFNEIQPLLFFLLGLGVLYSAMFGNVGLAYRQRAQLLPWLLIIGLVGLEQRYLKRALARDSKKKAQVRTGRPQLAPQQRAESPSPNLPSPAA